MAETTKQQKDGEKPLPDGPLAPFVYYARKIYNPLGFHKGYNFPLWMITCGAIFGFTLAKIRYLNWNTFLDNAIPGEQFWYAEGFRHVGIILHLATILPAGLLVVFQFVPIIRYKAMIFHRINGYVCSILLLLGNAGAFMITRHAVGGNPMLQAFIGILGVGTTVAIILAYINIKRLQIDQHRAWMLRAWVWAAAIISQRIIMIAANQIVTNWWTFYSAIPCNEIWHMYRTIVGLPDDQNPTSLLYPQCTGPDSTTIVLVSTRAQGPQTGPENIAATFHNTFGTSAIVAFTIHVVLLELYLALTPAESARLRMVSYERQLKAGYKHPEKGCLTATRLGDAPPDWNSPTLDYVAVKDVSDETLNENVEGRIVKPLTGPNSV